MTESSPNVLLIENDPTAKRLFTLAASEGKLGELTIISDGCEALDYFPKRNGDDAVEAPVPDLIILDLHLPKKDGKTILTELKSSPVDWQRIPTVVLSSSEDQTDIDEVYNLGANAYFTKPGDYEDFLTLIHEIRDFWLYRAKLPSKPNNSSLYSYPRFDLRCLVDDVDAPTEVTVFTGTRTVELATEWISIDVAHAVPLDEIR